MKSSRNLIENTSSIEKVDVINASTSYTMPFSLSEK